MSVKGYEIHGYGLRMYCKITEIGIDTDYYKCTMSFGTGFRKFCLIASYSSKKPYEIYIDRVEKMDVCILDGNLSEYDEGMVKFTKVALWAMKQMYPHVKKYTLKDDSQIHCADSRETMHMAFDYILKYNETWYQRKFNAMLPGFISKSADSEGVTKDSIRLTCIISEPNSIMDSVYKSFNVLDEKPVPLELVVDLLPQLLHHREEYETAISPRDFIHKLRIKLGKKYCNIVGKWLNSYMLYLNISIQMDQWYIPEKYIIEPPGFKAMKLSEKDLTEKLNVLSPKGGKRRTSKKYKYSIRPCYNMTNSFIGRYEGI